jgi:hypothetical protein
MRRWDEPLAEQQKRDVSRGAGRKTRVFPIFLRTVQGSKAPGECRHESDSQVHRVIFGAR